MNLPMEAGDVHEPSIESAMSLIPFPGCGFLPQFGKVTFRIILQTFFDHTDMMATYSKPDNRSRISPMVSLPLRLLTIYSGGVIGLQPAMSLLEAGYKVKLIAKHLPQDRSVNYTFSVAHTPSDYYCFIEMTTDRLGLSQSGLQVRARSTRNCASGTRTSLSIGGDVQ